MQAVLQFNYAKDKIAAVRLAERFRSSLRLLNVDYVCNLIEKRLSFVQPLLETWPRFYLKRTIIE